MPPRTEPTNPKYTCPSCSGWVVPARVIRADHLESEHKIQVEFWCWCSSDAPLRAKYQYSIPAMRFLFGNQFAMPIERRPAPLTPQEIDREVELFAFDLEDCDTVEEFERMCRLKGR